MMYIVRSGIECYWGEEFTVMDNGKPVASFTKLESAQEYVAQNGATK